MTTISVQTPVHVAAPRGAALAAWAFQALSSALARLSASRLERAERRAYASRIGDAASVRRYAQQVAPDDPRFAADLFSAADRHERFGK
jgi:hypothetical protein